MRAAALRQLRVLLRTSQHIDLQASSLRYNLLTLSAALEDVRLAGLETPDEPFAAASRVSVTLGPRTLLGDVEVLRLGLESPEITIRRNADGSSNLPDLGASRPAGGAPTLPAVRAQDVDVSVALEGTRIDIPAAAVDLIAPSPGRLSGTIEAQGGLRVTRGDRTFDAAAATAAIDFDGRRLTVRDLGASRPGTSVHLNGTLEFDGDPPTADLAFSGNTAVETWQTAADAAALVRGPLEVRGRIQGALTDPVVSVTADSPSLGRHDIRLQNVRASGSLRRGTIALERVTAQLGGGAVEGRGTISLGGHDRSRVDLWWSGVAIHQLTGGLPYLDRLARDGDALVEWRTNASAARTIDARATTGLVASGETTGVVVTARGVGDHWHLTAAPRKAADWTFDFNATLQLDAGAWQRSPLSGRLRLSTSDAGSIARRARAFGVPFGSIDLDRVSGAVNLDVELGGTLGRVRAKGRATARALAGNRLPRVDVESSFTADAGTRRSTGTFEVTAADLNAVKLFDGRDIDLRGSLVARGSWTGPLDNPQVDAEISGRDLEATVRGAQPLTATGGSFDASIGGPYAELNGKGTLSVDAVDIRAWPMGPVAADLTLSARELTVSARAPDTNTAIHGRLTLAAPFPFKGRAEIARTSLGRIATLAGKTFGPDDLSGDVSGVADVQGTLARPNEISVTFVSPPIAASVYGVSLVIEPGLRAAWRAGRLLVEEVTASLGDLSVRLRGEVPLEAPDGQFIADLDGDLSSLSPWLVRLDPDGAWSAIGRATGRLELQRSTAGLVITGTIDTTLDRITRGEQALADAVRLTMALTGTRVEIRKLTGAVLGGSVSVTGHAPLGWANEWLPEAWHLTADGTEGVLEASASFDVATVLEQVREAPAQPLTGTVTATAEFTSTRPDLGALVGAIRLDRVEVGREDTTLEQTGTTRLRLENRRLIVESLNWQAPRSRLVGHGGIDFSSSGESDLHLEITADLGGMRAVLPGRATGTITGKVDLLGSPGAWRVNADATMKDATMLLPRQGLFVDGVSGRVQLDGDAVSLSNVSGRINGGILEVDGQISLRPGAARGDSEGVRIAAEHVLLNVPQGLYSDVAANLRWRPVADGATFEGTVTITASRYREPVTRVLQLVESLSAATGGPDKSYLPSWLRRSTLDITIEVTDPLVIENSLGLVELVPDLQLVGTLAAPALSGRINVVDDGRINFGGRTYRLRESRLRFSPANGLEPTLEVMGETRVGDYDIRMRVTGTPGRIETSFDSTPPVSQHDLRSLLVTGSADTAEQSATSQDFALSAAASDVLGFAGKFVGLDSVRLGAVDLDLASKGSRAEQHLTVSKSFGRHLELIFSDNLESGSFTWVVVWKPYPNYELRYASVQDSTERFEFHHLVSFGPGSTGAVTKPRSGLAPTAAIVSAVTFAGNPGFSEAHLIEVVRLKPGRSFDVQQWIDDRVRLQRFYEQRGYRRARIVPRRVEGPAGTDRQSWALTYDIDRGPETIIETSGDGLPSSVVAAMYETWRGMPVADLLVPELERIVRDAMALDGYHRAKVHAELIADTPERARARVQLDRGPRTEEMVVAWNGNTVVSDAELDGVAAQYRAGPRSVDLEGTARTVEQLYGERGYQATKVRFADPAFDGDVATVQATVTEGPRSVLTEVALEGVAPERSDGAREALGAAAGDPFVATIPTEAVKRLRTYYANLGYHNATFDQRVEQRDNGEITMTVTVAEGLPSVVNDIRVERVGSTNQGLIRDAITLEPDAVAAQQAADTTRRNLYDIGTFSRVDVRFEPTAQEKAVGARLVDLAIEVDEPRRFQLRYGALISTDRSVRGGSGNLGFGASVELRDRNFLGRAIQASAGGRYEPDLQALSVLFASPRTFGLPVRTNIFVRERHEQWSLESAILSTLERDLTLEQRFRATPWSALSWGYTYGYRLYRLEENGQKIDFSGYLAGPTASLVLDRRDSPFDATRGWFHSSSFQLGVEQLGSDLGYFRYLSRQSVYRLAGPVTLAGSARWGALVGYSGTVPLSILDLFFLAGGTNTVRGYREGSLSAITISDFFLGGPSLLVLNGEIRFPIHGWLRGVVFVDSGNTFRSTSALALNRLAVGSGFGVRVWTPLAPLRLDLAYPVTTGFGPRRFRVHFSIGQMF